MRAWMVTVRDCETTWSGGGWAGGRPERVERRHYVVAMTRKSAMRQAKVLAGYPAEETSARAGIMSIHELEDLR